MVINQALLKLQIALSKEQIAGIQQSTKHKWVKDGPCGQVINDAYL